MTKRVAFAWEMGGGLGHIMAMRTVAKEFVDRGIEVFFILQDLSRVHEMLSDNRFHLLQAPMWLRMSPSSKQKRSLNYAQLLLQFSYNNPSGLSSIVKAWRELYELIQPDLLIVDHAPTALLASTDMAFPRVQIGIGFQSPPKVKPMPPFVYWENHSDTHLLNLENQVLDAVNKVLSGMQISPYKQLSDLFSIEKTFLTTFPELDHFPDRNISNEEYIGPIFREDIGVDPIWPQRGDKKIFLYLSTRYWDIENLLSILAKLNYQVLAYIGSSQSAIKNIIDTDNIYFSESPVNLRKIVDEVDLVISNSGTSTSLQFLLAGCPMLSIPANLEQYICGKRFEDSGFGLIVNQKQKKPDYKKYINKLIDNKKYEKAASQFANKYADFDNKIQIEKLTQSIINIIN